MSRYFLIAVLLIAAPLLMGARSASERDAGNTSLFTTTVSGASLVGTEVANFTFPARDELPSDRKTDITVAASLAIAPLWGVGISQLITRYSSSDNVSFWPSLLGAYAGAGLALGSMALLQRTDTLDGNGLHEGGYFNEKSPHGQVVFPIALFQILLPMMLPGFGAAAGYALGLAPRPRNMAIAFLRPTLFSSPVKENRFILGVQIVSAKF